MPETEVDRAEVECQPTGPKPLSFTTGGRALMPDDLYIERGLPNILPIFKRFMFPRIRSGRIHYRVLIVAGEPGCGKTWRFNAIGRMVENAYGMRNVHHIPVSSIEDGQNGFDKCDAQVIYVDDAYGSAGSRRSQTKERVEASIDYDVIRHNFEQVKGEVRGVVIVLWGIQRYMGLDTNFRNGAVDWKAFPENEGDDAVAERSIRNPNLIAELKRITWRGMVLDEPQYMCRSVCVVPKSEMHAGILDIPAVEPFLEFPTVLDDTKVFFVNMDKTLEVLDRHVEWRLPVALYRHTREKRLPVRLFPLGDRPAKYREPGKEQAWSMEASRLLASLNGEISRVNGRSLEVYVYERRKEQHREPLLCGGEFEPDIRCHQPVGFDCCKLIDLSKGRFLSIQKDMEPEAREALKAGLTHFILWVGDSSHDGHLLQPKKIPVNCSGVRISKHGVISVVR